MNSNVQNWYHEYNAMYNQSHFLENHLQYQAYNYLRPNNELFLQSMNSSYMPYNYFQPESRNEVNTFARNLCLCPVHLHGHGNYQANLCHPNCRHIHPLYGNAIRMGQTPSSISPRVNVNSIYQSHPTEVKTHSSKVGEHYRGSLNRIDSVSSFQNDQGLRIRNSLHDLIEYRRVVARTLSGKKSNISFVNTNIERKQQQPVSQDSTLVESLNPMDESILKELGTENITQSGIVIDSDAKEVASQLLPKKVPENEVNVLSPSKRINFFHKLRLFKCKKFKISLMAQNPKSSCNTPITSQNKNIDSQRSLIVNKQ